MWIIPHGRRPRFQASSDAPENLAPAQPGDSFEVRFDADEDAVVFRRISRSRDWLETMKKCPVPLDDLPARSKELFQSKL